MGTMYFQNKEMGGQMIYCAVSASWPTEVGNFHIFPRRYVPHSWMTTVNVLDLWHRSDCNCILLDVERDPLVHYFYAGCCPNKYPVGLARVENCLIIDGMKLDTVQFLKENPDVLIVLNEIEQYFRSEPLFKFVLPLFMFGNLKSAEGTLFFVEIIFSCVFGSHVIKTDKYTCILKDKLHRQVVKPIWMAHFKDAKEEIIACGKHLAEGDRRAVHAFNCKPASDQTNADLEEVLKKLPNFEI